MAYEKAIKCGILSAVFILLPFLGELLSFFFLAGCAFLYANEKDMYIAFALAIFCTFVIMLSFDKSIFTSLYFVLLQTFCCAFLIFFHQNIEKSGKTWWCPEHICVDRFIQFGLVVVCIACALIDNVDYLKDIYLKLIKFLETNFFGKMNIENFSVYFYNSIIGRAIFIIAVSVIVKTFIFYTFFIRWKQKVLRDDFKFSKIYSNKSLCFLTLSLYTLSEFIGSHYYIDNIKIFLSIAPLIYGLSVMHHISEELESNILLFFTYVFVFQVPYCVYFMMGIGILDSVLDFRSKFLLIKKRKG